jgi:regulator of sigma E protease
MQYIKPVFIILEVLLLFNLIIFVHELGHFLAARWRGLKIDRFAIWFGKPIWKTKINGVEYALGTIPAGGYVSLPQMAPMEMIEGKGEQSSEQLPPISAMDKIIVAVAGPLFSFGLAIAFAFIVWGVGKPEQRSNESTTIGWVDPTGPAWKAGLRPGDKILEVDNHPVTQFGPPAQDSVTWRIVTSEGEDIPIKYLRDGKEAIARPVPTKLPTKWYERKSLRKILVAGAQPAIIGEVATNSPAALAGLKEGDEVVKLDGKKIYSYDTIVNAEQMMTNGPVRSATFTIRRGAEEFEKTLRAEKPVKPADATPSFGITVFTLNHDEMITHPTPMSQIRDSAGQIFGTIKTLLSPKSDVGVQQLGGPVMIVRVYKTFLDADHGWMRVLWFSVVLNVNLALLNMLPFPVLDGGHITLALVEVIRRRPVSAKFLNMIQSACALALIAFMVYIGFFDTGDWVRSARQDRDQPIIFAPPQK